MTVTDLNTPSVEQQEVGSTAEQLQEIAFAQMVERGLADSDQGRTIDHDEMVRIIESWGK